MTIQVALYARVSSQMQIENFSIEAQLRAMREYVEAQGWTIFREYVDEGHSAATGNRPYFQILARDAQLRLFDVLLIHKLDRLYRHLGQLLEFVEILKERKIRLISVSEREDFTTPTGKMLLQSIGMISEFYLNNLREETIKGKLERAHKGLWNSDIPYGYCRGLCQRCEDPNGKGYCPNYGRRDKGNGKDLIAHPKDSNGVRLAFRIQARGGSDRQVADGLNQQGYRTNMKFITRPDAKRVGGPKPFGKETVRTMLQNEFYLGFVHYKQELLPGTHPALVDRELFDASQKTRRSLYHSRNSPENRRRFYLFSGLLHCADCGFVMRGRAYQGKSGEVRHYLDTAHERGVSCKQSWIVAADIESQIAAYIRHVRLPETWIARIVQLMQLDEQSLGDERQRLALKSRMDRLMKLYLDNKIGEADFEREAAKVERELTQLGVPVEISTDLKTRLQDLSMIWDLAGDQDRQELLRKMFKAIYVRGDKIERVEPRRPFKLFFEDAAESGAG